MPLGRNVDLKIKGPVVIYVGEGVGDFFCFSMKEKRDPFVNS